MAPFDSALEAARALVGVQAQVLNSGGLALSARVEGFSEPTLRSVLYERRELVKLWGQRRTLHLYDPADWPALHVLFRDRESWGEKAVRRVGGDVGTLKEVAVTIASQLEETGETLSRKLLLQQHPEWAPYLNLGIGVFMDVVQAGAACHAEPVGSESHFSHRRHWLPDLEWQLPERDGAGAEWARRYLHTYGPATPQDLAFWMGVKVSDARRWFAQIASETVHCQVDGDELVVLQRDVPELGTAVATRSQWPVRLLHMYDGLVLAHRAKDWLIDPQRYPMVWRKAGVVAAVVLSGGRIVGVWRYRRTRTALDIAVQHWGRWSKRVRKAVDREAERVAGHFGVGVRNVTWEQL